MYYKSAGCFHYLLTHVDELIHRYFAVCVISELCLGFKCPTLCHVVMSSTSRQFLLSLFRWSWRGFLPLFLSPVLGFRPPPLCSMKRLIFRFMSVEAFTLVFRPMHELCYINLGHQPLKIFGLRYSSADCNAGYERRGSRKRRGSSMKCLQEDQGREG